MKKQSFKRWLSIVTLVLFFLNFASPTIVSAANGTEESITISVGREVLGQEDILKPTTVKITNNEKVAVLVKNVLDSKGIKFDNSGTVDNNFYIQAIEVPEDGSMLGEFDHGSVSGWMYYVNGEKPDIGMSDKTLKNGDILEIKYTAKDFGGDIKAVESIDKLREKVTEAKKIKGDGYTAESFKNLTTEIKKAEDSIPTNEEIGKMMSTTLGSGDCKTDSYAKNMDTLRENIDTAISELKKDTEEPVLKPDLSIDLFNGKWEALNKDVNHVDSNDFNTIYLDKGETGKVIELSRMSAMFEPKLNGQPIKEVGGKYIVDLKEGINKLSIVNWGFTYYTTVTIKKLSYEITGDTTPGGTVTLKLNGVTQPIQNMKKYYALDVTKAEFSTDIPGLKHIESDSIYGANVDMDKISTIKFTIPKDVEPGEYTIKDGSIYQDWTGTSIGGNTEGNYSVFPNIKLNVTPKIDMSNVYNINLNNWSKYDKVFSLEDTIKLKLEGIEKATEVKVNSNKVNKVNDSYIVDLGVGKNTINVDGKDYEVNVKKISYTITNANKIIPGSKVSINFDGIEESLQKKAGEVNPNGTKTMYDTNLPGLTTAESENTGNFSNVDREVLNKITFTVPKDAKAGTYTMGKGRVWQAWYGYIDVIGSDYNGPYGSEQKNFSILPNIKFQVRDSIPEDKESPKITTTLKDNETVGSIKKSFKVMITDNVDTDIKPVVKVNNEVVDGSGSYTVTLNEGENNIEIEATDAAGNTSKVNYKINVEVKLREGASIILDTLNLELNNGESHQLIAVDAPDARGDETDETAPMTYKVIEGDDVVTVSKRGLVKGIKPGFAKISVRYPGLQSPAIVSVHVKDKNENIKINTTIEENKYDTVYFTGDSYNYKFKADANGNHITVYQDGKQLVKDSEGNYTANLKEGYNLIKIAATNGADTSYIVKNIRAKKVSYEISNLTNPGKEIVQGDKVSVKFTGLETPVPKYLRVFNPKQTRVSYKTNIEGMPSIFGTSSQYDIATKNAVEFTASKAGTFKFTNGCIDESWWGDELFSERDISSEGPNTSAVVRNDKFSKLPDFELTVGENKDYKNKYTATILNEGDIKPGDTVTIKINNLDMPDKDAGRIIRAFTVYNTNIKGLEEIQSEDAKDTESKLQTLKFTIPKDTKSGEYTITNGRVFKEWEPGILWVNSEFYKGLMPEIKLNVKGDNEVTPPVDPPTPPVVEPEKPVDVIEPSITVEKGIDGAVNWTTTNVKEPMFGNEWDIIGLSRSYDFKDKEYLDKYYNNLVKEVKEKKGNLTRNKYTEYSRTILAVRAMGKDPRNVGGHDLVSKLYDFDKVSRQGINGPIFALIALDSDNYKIPENANNSREKMINAILDAQLKDGSFSLDGENSNVDITAMALQALSKYKNEDKVKASIDRGLKFLSEVQLKDGGFETDGVKNLESSVQVLVALTSLGINPKTEMFVKDKNWIVSDIMKFKAEDGGFKHTLDGKTSNDMATEQALYGLAAYSRFLNKGTGLYDLTDVKLDNSTTDENAGNNNGDNSNSGNNGEGSNNGSNDNIDNNNGNSNSNEGGNTGVAGGNNTSNDNSNLSNSGNNTSGNSNSSNSNNASDKVVSGSEEGSRHNNLLLVEKSEDTASKDGENSKKDSNEKDKNENKEDVKLVQENTNENNIEDANNKNVATKGQPFTNMQVVFLTLAAVCVVLAIKEIAVRAYKKKKSQN